jgi:drug/metabolite transporter (DMT)-like permease
MISIVLGLMAASLWAVHDLIARVFTTRFGALKMAMVVLLAGAGLCLPIVLWRANWSALDQTTSFVLLGMGVAYAFGLGGLLIAFSKAPVSVVGPLTSAYPALVVVWGLANGLVPTRLAWFGLAAILVGVVSVGKLGPEDGGFKRIAREERGRVVFSCVSASFGFAAAAILGQLAATTVGAVETTFFSRFPAMLALYPLMLREIPSEPKLSSQAVVAGIAMAICDVVAVTSINLMGSFPNKEYGAMVVSSYGAVAAVLGVIFLKERCSTGQWFGIGLIAAGIALLSRS